MARIELSITWRGFLLFQHIEAIRPLAEGDQLFGCTVVVGM